MKIGVGQLIKFKEKKITTNTIVYIVLFHLLYSCKPKEDTPIPNKIAPELQSYFDSFLREAAIRGREVKIPPTGITLKFGKLEKYAGYTYFEDNTIIIDSVSWKSLTKELREWLVFHEFGHQLLNLTHNWNTLPNGEWHSVMWTAENAPNKNNISWGDIRRKYYVDQLFYPSTAIPDWSLLDYNPFPAIDSNRKLIAEQQFNNTAALQEYINGLPNAQCSFLSNSLLNVKLPRGFGFSLPDQKVMEWAGLSSDQITAFKQSTNYEIEIRYRINQSGIAISYGFTSPISKLGLYHNADLSAEIFSRDISFKSPNINFFNPNGQFNIIRIIRQSDFFSIYINNKHFFYSDVFDKQASNVLDCSIFGTGLNADFDLDYFRIYQRL